LLSRMDFSTDESYARGLRALAAPAAVTGYREVRYPKMDQVRSDVEAQLSAPTPSAELATTAA
ncbi:MAG TPA: hypothetical protein VMD30_07185, partial [Tepidisphaeraceae bacterium]|nr:hypothetical protein [Tepidisphaeraceae bacterium]